MSAAWHEACRNGAISQDCHGALPLGAADHLKVIGLALGLLVGRGKEGMGGGQSLHTHSHLQDEQHLYKQLRDIAKMTGSNWKKQMTWLNAENQLYCVKAQSI